MMAQARTYKIAVLPGDGIGPEVVDAALSILQKLVEYHELSFSFKHYDFSAGTYAQSGRLITKEDMDELTCHLSEPALLT